MNTSTLSLTIQLPKFEGPLALLLYLIRKDEMDIFDIEIHRITAQYLDFIRMMKELDLEVAGEFVAMASTLIQIKSRMLLPQYDEQGEVVEGADPRKELVQRLLEYQKYQEASKNLYERPLMGRDFWGRGTREKFEERIQEEIELEENALFSLISAYRRSYRAAMKRVHKVTAKAQSIQSRILEMKSRLIIGSRVGLSEFITGSTEKRRQVLITFLATLELAKMGFVRLFQSDVYQEIHIETVTEIETASLSKVEEYESLHNEEGEGLAGLAPLTYDSVSEEPTAAESAQLEFELRDADEEAAVSQDPLFKEEDMASDDEIFAAEQELAGVVVEARGDEVAPEPRSEDLAVETEAVNGESFEMAENNESFEIVNGVELTDAMLVEAEIADAVFTASSENVVTEELSTDEVAPDLEDVITTEVSEETAMPLELSDEPEVHQDLMFAALPEIEFAIPTIELEPSLEEETQDEIEAAAIVSDDGNDGSVSGDVAVEPAAEESAVAAIATTATVAAETEASPEREATEPHDVIKDEVKDVEV